MKEYKGYFYKIETDYFPESPDYWCDNEIFLVYDHNQFYIKRDGFNPEDIFYNPEKYDNYFIFPVYAYIHSYVLLSLSKSSDRFDTSMRGFVLVKKGLRDSLLESDAKSYAENLLFEWNSYLLGDIYCYKVIKRNVCPHCGNTDEEEVDFCGGFYDKDECEDECKNLIDSYEINKA